MRFYMEYIKIFACARIKNACFNRVLIYPQYILNSINKKNRAIFNYKSRLYGIIDIEVFMKVLLVEDEVQMSEAIAGLLRKNKYLVECAFDGEEGLQMGLVGDYDVIIMDIMMPVIDGYEVVRLLRKRGINTPIIMLTALSSVEDKVKGLDIGADDYLTKPFSIDELEARLRAIARRRGQAVADNNIKVGKITLNIKQFTLSAGERSIALSGKEYELAFCFFSNPSAVFTKDELINKVWGFECDFESNNLEVYISFLRKKLSYLDPDVTISSVRGVGYKLVYKGANG